MTHNTRTPQTVPVFAGYLVLGMGYGLVECEQKESSLRRFGRRTRPSKTKETFTEKTCPLKKEYRIQCGMQKYIEKYKKAKSSEKEPEKTLLRCSTLQYFEEYL